MVVYKLSVCLERWISIAEGWVCWRAWVHGEGACISLTEVMSISNVNAWESPWPGWWVHQLAEGVKSWWGGFKWAIWPMEWTMRLWRHKNTHPFPLSPTFLQTGTVLMRTLNFDWWVMQAPSLIHVLRQAVTLFFILSCNFISGGQS